MTATVWARGDYPKIAVEMVGPLGPALVDALGIEAGQKVLDVAAGTGNAAIAAAERGAHVVASDVTPELLAAGRERPEARSVELEWIEADAQQLPFADEEFDVVMSTIGVMFAPNHQRCADELVRVCRPGGTIGLLSWTPTGTIGALFRTMGPHAPKPPAGAQPPPLWGSTAHLDELFGERVQWTTERVESLAFDEFDTPPALVDYFRELYGPTIAVYEYASQDPERLEALERDFLAFAEAENLGTPDAARYELEYLVTVGRKV
jgi:ubiquinone/menaquinone biosynthesis C-methylase UbiE